MYLPRKLTALLLAAFTAIASASAQSWPEQLSRALTVLSACPDARRTLAEAPSVDKHIPPTRFDVDVTGLPYVWLLTTGGGDGTGGDHTCWVEPKLTRADGTVVPGETLPIELWTAGWSHLQTITPKGSRRLKVAGTSYDAGWWIHPDSVLCLKLDGNYTRLTIGGGTDSSAHASRKVGFAIAAALDRQTALNAVASFIATAHPEAEAWLRADLNTPANGHLALLKTFPDTLANTLEAQIDRHARRLGLGGTEFRKRLADVRAADRADLTPRLQLYADVRRAAAVIDETASALDFAQRTLAFVERLRPLPEQTAKLNALRHDADTLPTRPDGDWPALLAQVKALRRDIILHHPALDFDDLLINKQPTATFSHQCDQYLGRHSRPGPGLVVLKNWKSAHPQEIALLKGKLPTGSVAHPDLSYDGKRILFAYCDHSQPDRNRRRYYLYEINADGSGLRQLTGTANDPLKGEGDRKTVLIEDFDPCYLPDGDIVFVSTRCQTFGRCHHRRYNPSYLLYKMDANGNHIRQLSFGEANEWDPSVLPDGRVIYTRWDYINRHDVYYQSLWTMRPDGTGTAHFYGNYTINPCMTAEARAIPGTHKVVSTAMAHHGYTAGSIISIDPLKGEDGPNPITRLTPEIRFPETEGGGANGAFQTPWPLSEDLLLVAYTPEKLVMQGSVQSPNAYGIMLIDSLGGREEIYRDPNVSCVSPIPLTPRPRPIELCSTLPPNAPPNAPGRVYIQNANLGRQNFGAPIRSIRMNVIIGQPTPSVPHRSAARQEIVKRVAGVVDVNPDGSTAFEMPSGVPVQLQALDADGLAVMTMRSFIFAQPGESMSCVGCHENKAQAAPAAMTNRVQLKPVRPLAGQDYPGGFSFMRSVQPVLDRHCIRCHGLGDKLAGDLDLRGTLVSRPCDGYPGWPTATTVATSYNSLLNRKGLFRLAQRNEETGESRPRDYFAHSGRLIRKLLDGHCPSLLQDETGLNLVKTWLDLNVQYFGDYSWSRAEDATTSPDGEKALRAAIRQRFGEPLASQPFACLVNPAAPEQSRILQLALPTQAHGWGQLTGKNAFAGRDDPDWLRLRDLVKASIRYPAPPAPDGTCNRPHCICGSCWVPKAQ